MEREIVSIFFSYQKLKEILIRYSWIILTASKDRLISKIWRVWLKNWARHAHLNLVNLTSLGPELQGQNRVDVNYEKTFGLRASYKSTLEEQYFIESEPKVEVISSKIDRMAAI